MKAKLKTNDITFNNVDINDMVKTLAKERSHLLEEFSKVYLAESGLMPSEVELVTIEDNKNNVIETVYFFRKKV